MTRPTLLLAGLALLLGGCASEQAEPADGPSPDPSEIRTDLAALSEPDRSATWLGISSDWTAERSSDSTSGTA